MNYKSKTVSTTSTGIVVSFTDVNKHKFIPYENTQVKNLQINGTKKYQSLEKRFTKKQQAAYARLVYGLDAFSEKEIAGMSLKTKMKIATNHNKVQKFLNKLKQEVVNSTANNFLNALFPKSEFVKSITKTNDYDEKFHCTLTFKELGITKFKIAEHLVKINLLPIDFFAVN